MHVATFVDNLTLKITFLKCCEWVVEGSATKRLLSQLDHMTNIRANCAKSVLVHASFWNFWKHAQQELNIHFYKAHILTCMTYNGSNLNLSLNKVLGNHMTQCQKYYVPPVTNFTVAYFTKGR